MYVKLFHHDRCFDGACSAAIFADFFRKQVDSSAEFGLGGLFHQAKQQFDVSRFDGDQNVIVDFKYCGSSKLTWWFDHHQSAFLSKEDEQHFRGDRSGKKFYDPSYRSCTKFIAHVASEKFGYDASAQEELIRWADIIDGAQYSSAKEAVEMVAPAMKLTLVLEASEESMTSKIIPLMTSRSLEEIASLPEIQASFEHLYQRHVESIDIIRKRSSLRDTVLYFDLSDTSLAGYNKFIPYYLFPESTYTVSVADAGFREKISVGSNPWAAEEPAHNLATLCERYGGGGHARVGAISYGAGEIERARETALKIVRELAGDAPAGAPAES
jgi:hypothetical protein